MKFCAASTKFFIFILIAVFFYSELLAREVFADKLCVKRKVSAGERVRLSRALKIVPQNCPSGFAEILDTATFRGQDGTNGQNGADGADGVNGTDGVNGVNGTDGQDGQDGADGSLRIYGNGSNGALSITSSQALDSTTHQYTDITIQAGVTLTVQSGTVLRCTGNFINNGTISVEAITDTGFVALTNSDLGTSPSISVAHQGMSRSPAASGAFGTDAGALIGGTSGVNMTNAIAREIYRLGIYGGGGGGPSLGNPFAGSRGGGTFTVLCAGTVTNSVTGSIAATGINGAACFGGGGGGMVVLASPNEVSNQGTIDVSGGQGGASSTSCGAGGGGGGGLIKLISLEGPNNTGTTTVLGGATGSNAVSVTNSPRMAGGGGGSSYGAGGSGSSVTSLADGNVSSGNTAGSNGLTLLTSADPTSLF